MPFGSQEEPETPFYVCSRSLNIHAVKLQNGPTFALLDGTDWTTVKITTQIKIILANSYRGSGCIFDCSLIVFCFGVAEGYHPLYKIVLFAVVQFFPYRFLVYCFIFVYLVFVER